MHPSPEIPRVHKIVLNSADRAAGTNANAYFTNVRLPDTFKRQAVIAAASWHAYNNDAGHATDRVYNVHLDGVFHPNSYSSRTGSTTDILFTTTGYKYDQMCTTDNTIGIVALDPTVFVNKSLNVIVESPIDPTLVWTAPWVLTLIIYEHSTAEILG